MKLLPQDPRSMKAYGMPGHYDMRILVPFKGHSIEGQMLEDVCIHVWGTCLVSLMPRFSFHRGFKY